MAMLEGQADLTVKMLNDSTQAWVEMEYNRRLHSEISMSPMERFLDGTDVGRKAPASDEIKAAFRLQQRRKRRRTDSTVSLEGKRFEIPAHYRGLDHVTLAYARWDLGFVHLIDERSGGELCRIYPQDKVKNSDSLRRTLTPEARAGETVETPKLKGLPPLMTKLLADFAATGCPMPYIPQMSEDHRRE